MAASVTLLTPHAGDPRYVERWKPLFAAYGALFARHGVALQPLPWPRASESRADLTLANLAWGYHFDGEAFARVLEDWPAERRLVNAPRLLLWNMRKTYLQALDAAGVATIPTMFLDAASPEAVQTAFARFGGDRIVVKRQVSAGGHDMALVRLGEDAALPGGPVMIQPFLPAVGGEGELSLFLFGGRFAYAARKVAAAGEYRIQPQYGGRLTRFEPDAEALALAYAAVGACPVPPVYARADMVRDPAGTLRLMELEAIEPDLYFDLAPDGGDAFAQAVLAER